MAVFDWRFLSQLWLRLKSIEGLGVPGTCVLCKSRYKGPDAICNPCYAYFKPLPSICTQCALPVADAVTYTCRNCVINKPAFDHTVAAYYFEEPLRTLLLRYKYQGALYLRSIFIRLMSEAWIQARQEGLQTEFLMPVPLYIKKLRKRGFNQAAELTKILAHRFNIPYALDRCKRVNIAPSQVDSTADQRRKNLLNAFSIKPLPYQNVTLVDDVMTTGSTAHTLASILKAQGVKQVSVWCCARTVPRSY